MRTFCVVTLALVVVSMAVAQTFNPRETVTVGIPVTLGMSEDSIVKKLAESNHKVTKRSPTDALKQQGVTSMWFVDDGAGGAIFFSSGRLTSVSKDLLPDEGGQVEFGRHIYFSMRDLQTEGDSHCTIETENGEVSEFAQKTARLRCGKNSLLIYLPKMEVERRPFNCGRN